MNTYTIGQITKEFGLTHRAIRFYEERGLIAPTRGGGKGCVGWDRFFDDRDRRTLAAIVDLKTLGFTLSEIVEIIREGNGEVILSDERIQRQIAFLEKTRAELDAALAGMRDVIARRAAA